MGNLHGLEFALRAFLTKHNETLEPSVDVGKLAVGDKVPVNSFTSYAALGRLVSEFNSVAGAQYQVDTGVVDLRDMLAHGRVAMRDPTGANELVKFGPEDNGYVTVTHKAVLDRNWFRAKIGFVFQQLQRVKEASQEFGQGIMEDA